MKRYEVDILGKLWMGGTAVKSSVRLEAESDEDAIRQAKNDGDFQLVEDVRLYRKEKCHKCPEHDHSYWVFAQDWSLPTSEGIFFQCGADEVLVD